jgi:WD40-like Beta Propeller Repeat
MKQKITVLWLFLIVLGCNPDFLWAQSFKKGYRFYQKKQMPSAVKVFEKHQSGKKNGLPSRFFLHKIRVSEAISLGKICQTDEALRREDSLYALASQKRKKKWQRYAVQDSSISDLRYDLQLRAIAQVRVRGSFADLDSLLTGLKYPLPKVQAAIDSTRADIVNAHISHKDYDVLTTILQKYQSFIRPANFKASRRIPERLWPAFQEKYSLCELDRFARDHPKSFVGRDCWWEETRQLLCNPSLPQLLDFHARNRFTGMEVVVLNTINNLKEDSTKLAQLNEPQKVHLEKLRQRNILRTRLSNGHIGRDSVEVMRQIQTYVADFAPRYSAFRLLEDALQVFLEKKMYRSAAQLLEQAKPFFPDTLPRNCHSDFEYQVRVQPFIKSRLDILKQTTPQTRMLPLNALNTEFGDECHPVMSSDGKMIYFAAADRPETPSIGFDVFRSKRDSTGWSVPIIVPELSGSGDQLPLSLTADGQQMLLYVNNKLHLSRKRNDHWSIPEPLTIKGLPLIGKGFLSPDGKILIIEGAYSAGGMFTAPDIDLFVCFLDSTGQWSSPAGLGAEVNTEGDEGNPYLMPDGQTLYFTSTGYPGLGQSDVFVTKRGKKWAFWDRATNLGREINDTYRHQGFGHVSKEGKMALMARYIRDGEKGDIWMLEY